MTKKRTINAVAGLAISVMFWALVGCRPSYYDHGLESMHALIDETTDCAWLEARFDAAKAIFDQADAAIDRAHDRFERADERDFEAQEISLAYMEHIKDRATELGCPGT